jgi:hypothetical protein
MWRWNAHQRHVSKLQTVLRGNFHSTIGAIDGKHIQFVIRCPPSAGSLYYNYKGFRYVALLALVDADYTFIFIDIGANGTCSYCIFRESGFVYALRSGNA